MAPPPTATHLVAFRVVPLPVPPRPLPVAWWILRSGRIPADRCVFPRAIAACSASGQPTAGSRWKGVMPLAGSFDTAGWFAREAGLLRQVGEVLFGEASPQDVEPAGLLIARDAFNLLEAEARARLDPAIAHLEARLGKANPIDVISLGGNLESMMLTFRTLQARGDLEATWRLGAKGTAKLWTGNRRTFRLGAGYYRRRWPKRPAPARRFYPRLN